MLLHYKSTSYPQSSPLYSTIFIIVRTTRFLNAIIQTLDNVFVLLYRIYMNSTSIIKLRASGNNFLESITFHRYTRKTGTWDTSATLIGPLKNRKTGTRDLSGTLMEAEKKQKSARDPCGALATP